MESDYEIRVQISRAADDMSVLAGLDLDAVRVRIDKERGELETALEDPHASEKDVELLRDCMNINIELLALLERADQHLYREISNF